MAELTSLFRHFRPTDVDLSHHPSEQRSLAGDAPGLVATGKMERFALA